MVRTMRGIHRALLRLDHEALRDAQDAQDALLAQRIAKKALYSAISNAENNHSLDIDSLVVAEAYVGKNLIMKRFSPRARGRAARIEKPFSEITIVVRELGEAA